MCVCVGRGSRNSNEPLRRAGQIRHQRWWPTALRSVWEHFCSEDGPYGVHYLSLQGVDIRGCKSGFSGRRGRTVHPTLAMCCKVCKLEACHFCVARERLSILVFWPKFETSGIQLVQGFDVAFSGAQFSGLNFPMSACELVETHFIFGRDSCAWPSWTWLVF